MKKEHQHINKILPFGELIRGFANQSYISKVDLKNFLRTRGIYFNNSEKENLVPCLSTLLLSPSEFDILRDYQNTREDNIKKNTCRLEWNTSITVLETLDNFSFENLIPNEGVNFWFNSEPQISILENNPNKILIYYEIERDDLNKSWYQSTDIFKGEIKIEKVSANEIKITKSYTSSESNLIGDNLLKSLLNHFKNKNFVQKDKELIKILFSDFSNENRIKFFYRLSSDMNCDYFEFKDIINTEFRPDPLISLPDKINWMENKSELKLKGNQIHNTFFIRDKEFYKNLQFWEIESSFNFKYSNYKGSCNVIFSFQDFLNREDKSEFEISISNFNLYNSTDYTAKEKTEIKNIILDLFEQNKDETYKNFIEYVKGEK